MKKELTVLLSALVAFLILISKSSYAHPGRTAADGCHYCRTRCDYWGEVWNARHCHGGYTAPAPTYSVSTPTPTSKPKPTPKPTLKPTLTPTTSPSPTQEVLGETEIESTPTPEPQVGGAPETDSVVGGLVGGAVLLGGGYLGLKWLARVTASKEETTPPPTD